MAIKEYLVVKRLWLMINKYYGFRLIFRAIQRFTKLSHTTRAAALTYTTLFALVPLMTVIYSVLSLLPSLQQGSGAIEQLLMDNLMPASGDALMGYLHQFSRQAQQLTVVGIILLMITAFMMLRAIENTFNQIWQLPNGRKGLSSFLLYWAILSLGPLMLSAGFAVSSYIASLGLWKEDWVPTIGTIALGVFIPYIFSFLAFTLIYWAVPNCNVSLKHAAIGGAATSLLFELGKEIFSAATTFFPSYQLIYGAFAAVPLFLLWLYVSWVVILFGAEVVYLQGVEAAAGMDDSDDMDATADTEQGQLLLGLHVLAQLQAKQAKGEGDSFNDLHARLSTNTKSSLLKSLQWLVVHKLILEKKSNGSGRGDECIEYFLIRDLNQYSLFQYLQTSSIESWKDIISLQSCGHDSALDKEKLLADLSKNQRLLELELNTPLQEYLRIMK
jgi:membrane protein